MKKVFAVIIKDGSEGQDVCAMASSFAPQTGFPGCWEIEEPMPEIIDRISGMVNEFIAAEPFEQVVFGCSECAAEDIISRLDSASVRRLSVKQLPEFIGEI